MKKIIVFMLAVLFVFGLASCGEEKTDIRSDYDDYENYDEKEEGSSDEDEEKIEDEKIDVPMSPEELKYNNALNYIDNGNYEEAYDLLMELGEYKDAAEMLSRFRYVCTKKTIKIGENISYKETIYNENNLPSKHICSYYDGTEEKYEYTYDSDGKIIKELYENEYGETYVNDYEYDDDGNLTKNSYFLLSYDKPLHVDTYTYDENGYLVKHLHTTNSGFKYSHDYIYNENGKMTKDVYKNLWSNEENTIDYIYDTDGKLITESHTSSSGEHGVYEHTYDVNGNLIKKTYISNGEESLIYDYTYDSNGNLVKSIFSDNTVRYTEYDKNGNLIKMVEIDATGNEITSEMTYDSNGNRIKSIITNHHNGREQLDENIYNFVYIPYDLAESDVKRLNRFFSGL